MEKAFIHREETPRYVAEMSFEKKFLVFEQLIFSLSAGFYHSARFNSRDEWLNQPRTCAS